MARILEKLWQAAALLAFLPALLLSVQPAAAQHGAACACGRPQNVPSFFEIDHGTSVWAGLAPIEFGKWDLYADVFSWGTGNGAGGSNGINEIIFFGAATTLSQYGLVIDTGTFGVTYIDPDPAFGDPDFNACPIPAGTTCGTFTETDVIMNSDFNRGWTSSAPNYSDTGPANYGATALHEMGHALGVHHSFDQLSTMNYYEDFATIYLGLSDTNIARAHYPAVARNVVDMATYPFRVSGFQYAGTTVASPSPTSVQVGNQFTLSNFTAENVGTQALSNVRLEIRLSTNTIISTADELVGTVFFSSFGTNTWWDTTGTVFSIPSSVPAGTYYVGGLITYDNTTSDGISYNNSWVLDAARRITVTPIPTYTISLSSSPAAGGTVSGGGTFQQGSFRTMTATPSTHYNFVNWTEGSTVVSTSPSYGFTVNSSRTLVANFALKSYTLSLSASPAGGGSVSGGGTFQALSSRTVTATPSTHYNFVNWTQGSTVVSTSPSYSFTLNSSRTLVAHFALKSYTLSLSASPAGGGTVSGGGTFPALSSRTVTATPNLGWRFVNWTEGATQVSTSASYTFPLNGARTLVANFAQVPYTITVSGLPPAGGTVSGGGTFPGGSSRTVTATPNASYSFAKWTEGGTQVSTSASYTFTLGGNRNLVANFILGGPPIGGDLLVDFPSTGGLWQYLNNSTWVKIHAASPLTIASGDLNGTRKDEAIASFAGSGLFARYDNATWIKLHATAATRFVAGDLDLNGSGRDDLIVDFGSSGIWAFYNNASWTQLHASTSQALAIGDVDDSGRQDLIIDFGGPGLWQRLNNTTWSQIHSQSPTLLATGDLDGGGKADVIVAFPSAGLWVRYNNNAPWVRVHTTSPEGVIAGDLDRDGKDELIADFGSSVWARYNNSSWVRLRTGNAVRLAVADLDQSGRVDLIVDFGGSTGSWRLLNNASWSQLHPIPADGIVAGSFD